MILFTSPYASSSLPFGSFTTATRVLFQLGCCQLGTGIAYKKETEWERHQVTMSSSSLDVVTLNVGGQKFMTTRHTLSAKEDSFLAKLEKHNLDGEIFIDRDPTVFHLILNYLRDDRVVFPADGLTAALLFQEAKYYKLDKLVEMISMKSLNSNGYMDLKEF